MFKQRLCLLCDCPHYALITQWGRGCWRGRQACCPVYRPSKRNTSLEMDTGDHSVLNTEAAIKEFTFFPLPQIFNCPPMLLPKSCSFRALHCHPLSCSLPLAKQTWASSVARPHLFMTCPLRSGSALVWSPLLALPPQPLALGYFLSSLKVHPIWKAASSQGLATVLADARRISKWLVGRRCRETEWETWRKR